MATRLLHVWKKTIIHTYTCHNTCLILFIAVYARNLYSEIHCEPSVGHIFSSFLFRVFKSREIYSNDHVYVICGHTLNILYTGKLHIKLSMVIDEPHMHYNKSFVEYNNNETM